MLYRQTSFGTFGGGGEFASCNILAHTCCTSGAPNCDKSTGVGSGGKSGPPGSTTDPGGNTVPGGIGGTGIPPGSNTDPGGNAVPGGSGKPGGAGMSVTWSTRRTYPDATVVSPVPSGAVASKSSSIAMAATPAKSTCITRTRRHR